MRHWRCVTLVVASDSADFLTEWASLAFSKGVLAWPTRVLALTRRPITDLSTLHLAFSHANALVISCPSSTGCGVWCYLPYSPPEAQVVQVARWTPYRGLSLTLHLTLFPDKFNTFSPRPTLVVAAEEFQPHVLVRQAQGEADFTIVGPMASLLHILSHSLNFSYTFKRPPDGSWGTKRPDGTWTGMVGMVRRQEADISLGPFGMSAVRAEAVDFTVPILIDYARILASRGRPEVDPWGFWLPLTPSVWVAFLGSMVLLVIIVVLLASCCQLEEGLQDGFLGDTTFAYLRVFLQQDTKVAELRWWRRLVLGCWMLLTLVLTRSYSSTLMSLLAVRYIPQPFQTLSDLLDRPATTMIWEANTAYVQYYRSVVSGVFVGVKEAEREGRIRFVKSTEYDLALDQLVRPGRHAFIFEDLTGMILKASDFSRTGRCDFYSSREMFLPFMFCMIAQKHSPLIHAINRRVKRMTEAGMYDHWLAQTIPNSTTCLSVPTTVTVTSTLSLANTWGMFAVLGLGLLLALLVFVSEVVVARCL